MSEGKSMNSKKVKRTLASIFTVSGLSLCLAAVPAMAQSGASSEGVTAGAPNGAMQAPGNPDSAQVPGSVAVSPPDNPESPVGAGNGNGMASTSNEASGSQAGSSMNS